MRSIVIAEDELLLRQALIKQIKTHCDYDVVHESPNGEDALKWLRSHPADILLTDIRMPKMDGIQLLASLKEEQLPVKTIIISGYDDFQYVQQVLRLGAADYLLKPVSCENLHQVLETVSSAIVRQEIDENLQKTALLLELKQSGRYYPSVSVPKLLDPFPTGGITACC